MSARRWTAALVCLLAWPAQAQEVMEYIHTDALGSVVVVTDQARNVLERREYEPYGKQLAPLPVENGPGYTGHVQDALTGLVQMQQRYMDPGIGRFLSVDPVTAFAVPGVNFNRYAYAANNPYRFTDPDGRLIRNRHEQPSKPNCAGRGAMCIPPRPWDRFALELKVVGSKKFKEKVAAVEERANTAGINVFRELRDAPGLTEIIESNRTRFAGGMAEGRVVGQVFWNSSEGALIKVSQLTGSLRLQSPGLGLMHELGHARQMIVQGLSGALPEGPVIFGIESDWANAFGEPVRDPFRAHGGYSVDGKGLFDHE